jgi:alpha-N-arabinofuranosidase
MQSVQKAVALVGESIGTISPYLHGQFAEHLGELVYPGVWVGEDSSIPNTDGIRNDVIEALKPLQLPVLRWPGGCFADTYHWRDGIGPRANRPTRVNVHWGMAPEPNAFGTHEFARFCELIGTAPYFAANMGSGTVEELQQWVEYCNFAGNSTLAEERRKNGRKEPFNVRYWGVGNENWGCGGNMNPEQYADMYMRYRTYVYRYPGSDPFAIAAGPCHNDWAWTRRFLERSSRYYGFANRNHMVQGFAAHYYCGTAGKSATDYTADQWLELLAKARGIEGLIVGHRSIMDEYDPQRAIKLIFDEWGTWHPVEPGKPMGGLYQQNTMRDALVAALSLDVFNNQADKVYMANIAQMINVLQALLLVKEESCVKTPTYHVFDLYRPHKGANAVRFLTAGESLTDGGPSAEFIKALYLDKSRFTLKALEGSASVKDGVLCVTACNTHPTEPIDFELEVRGGKVAEARAVTLAGKDILALNTFEKPNAVKLSRAAVVKAKGRVLRVELPAGSVVRIMGAVS